MVATNGMKLLSGVEEVNPKELESLLSKNFRVMCTKDIEVQSRSGQPIKVTVKLAHNGTSTIRVIAETENYSNMKDFFHAHRTEGIDAYNNFTFEKMNMFLPL
jgi:hypothetical protein